MLTKTILQYLSLGLKNFRLLPHRWQHHIRPIERKFNVDIRTNWPLGSVVLSSACFCQPKIISSTFSLPSKQSRFEQNEA